MVVLMCLSASRYRSHRAAPVRFTLKHFGRALEEARHALGPQVRALELLVETHKLPLRLFTFEHAERLLLLFLAKRAARGFLMDACRLLIRANFRSGSPG